MYTIPESNVVILTPTEDEVSGKINVRLNSTGSQAKGIGYEKDTQLAIRWLESNIVANSTVADIGTGTGILAIVAAKLGAKVSAYEVEPSIREIAMNNFELNAVEVTFYSEFIGQHKGYDLVVANLGYKEENYEGVDIAGSRVWTTNDG